MIFTSDVYKKAYFQEATIVQTVMRNIAKTECMIVTLLLTVFQQRVVFIVSADWDSHRSR